MKLRIICGTNAHLPAAQKSTLKTLFKSESFMIEGSGDVQVVPLGNGRQAFIAGYIFGFRTPTDDIAPTHALASALGEAIDRNDMDKARRALEGRFVMAITGPGDRCILFSDAYGKRDIYHGRAVDADVFVSDLSLLPDSPAVQGYNSSSLVHVLSVYGFRPPKKHTLYKGIRRVGVEEMVRVENGKATITRESFNALPVGAYGKHELNRYADIFLDAVKLRGSRYGNVVSLSSGWDSTAILAALVHVFGTAKVRAVIGRMIYAKRSGIINQFEIDRAKAVADYFGVRLDIVDLDYRKHGPDYAEALQPLLRANTMSSISSISQYLLYDFVSRTTNGDESVFVGEISDGAHNLGFSQFVTIFHPVLSFREYSDKMASYLFGPTFLGLFQKNEFSADPIYALFRQRAGSALFDKPSKGGPGKRTLQLLSSFFLRANRIPLWSLKNCKMLKPRGIDQYQQEMEAAYLAEAAEQATPETLYSWYLHLYNTFHWQSSMIASRALVAEDRGLRMALPFWDSRLQEFLSAMPEDWGRGLDLNPTKYPLKWTLANRIDYPMHLQVGPHSYLYDIDPRFSHSAELVYGSAFNGYFKRLLRSRAYEDILDPQVFDLGYIDGIVDRFLTGEETRGAELTDLFSLCMLMMVGWYGQRGSK